ncbi:Arm DNA-binding domain-containing protein [Flexistipes sp.]|uniref:Arm DNA-binding domain-containing protein n=1 Tax=Flexistipes sp. TaxID=3088135 RepID=UPI002E1ED78C|nr:DUF3596 domain-containing protein [Flexistipes sp.]
MGVYKRNNKLWISFTYMEIQCREPIGLDDTAANREEASLMCNQIKRQIRAGSFDYSKWFPESKNLVKFGYKKKEKEQTTIYENPTVEELADEWLENCKKRGKKRKTLISYSDYRNRTVKILGKKRIRDLKIRDLDHFIEKLLDAGYDPKTIKNTRLCLSQIYKLALKKEIVNKNLMSECEGVSIKNKKIYPFNDDEVDKILEHIEKNKPKFYAMFKVLLLTGMRVGEVLAMKWENYNRENGTYFVCESVSLGEIGPPKTQGSIRKVKLITSVVKALNYHYDNFRVEGSKFIFNTQYGTHYNKAENIKKNVWIPTLKKLGIEYRIMYQCRHTYASISIAEGDTPAFVARNLGHTSLKMVYDVYVKDIRDGNRSNLENRF